MKIFKNWIRLFFVSFIVSMTSIALFNFFVDSAGIFGNKSYLAKVAEELVSGKMIAGLSDYNERVFQELIIKKSKKKNDMIILGSSRSMMIREKNFKNIKNFFNHSVSGATLEDYMAIVDLYENRKSYIPKNIILAIDPWIFNKFNSQNRWKVLKENYFHFLSKIMKKSISSKKSFNSSKIKQLINYEYTASNIAFLKKIFQQNPYYITKTIDIEDSIKGLDGSMYYPSSKRSPNFKVVKQRAIQFATNNQVVFLERFNNLSHTYKFENFISYLQESDVNIRFVLFPYHPISYDLLIKDKRYAIIEDVELYLKEFAKDNNIEIFGSYNPHKFNFTNRDFMDGMHGLERVTKKILERN